MHFISLQNIGRSDLGFVKYQLIHVRTMQAERASRGYVNAFLPLLLSLLWFGRCISGSAGNYNIGYNNYS